MVWRGPLRVPTPDPCAFLSFAVACTDKDRIPSEPIGATMEDLDARLEFRLPASMKTAFLAAASNEDQDAAQLLRRFIREYLRLRTHAQGSLLSPAKPTRRKG